METEKIIDNVVEEIVEMYNIVNHGIDEKAKNNLARAYGGVIRSRKGKLVETIADIIIEAAWESVGGKTRELKINSNKFEIPTLEAYLNKLPSDELREYCNEKTYKLSVDRHVFIKRKFVMGMECKSYTENAMMKRILFDFHLLKTLYPDITCYLLQLESQLGGDYSECKENPLGSQSTHTLLSYFPDVKLNIITLVKGERKVDKPIHKTEFFKPIEENQIRKAIILVRKDLRRFI